MTNSRSSLGTLLIISAVDMLLCCFTMGVMLFLVFQPTLSSSQTATKLLGIAGFETIPSAGAGLLATPAVIVIDNLGPNRVFAASPPPGYAVPTTIGPSAVTISASGPLVLTAVESPSLAELKLRSTKDNGPTLAKISLAAHGTFYPGKLDCPNGGELSIDLTRNNPILTRCDPEEGNLLCPLECLDNGSQPFDIKPSDVDPQSVRVLVVPLHGHLTFSGPSICVLSPNFGPDSGEAT